MPGNAWPTVPKRQFCGVLVVTPVVHSVRP